MKCSRLILTRERNKYQAVGSGGDSGLLEAQGRRWQESERAQPWFSIGEFIQLSCSPPNAPGQRNLLLQQPWGLPKESSLVLRPPPGLLPCHQCCLAGSTGTGESEEPRAGTSPLAQRNSCPQWPGDAKRALLNSQP